MRDLPGFPSVKILQPSRRMIALVNNFRLSFPFIFDPRRLDIVGNLECIQVPDSSIPKFGDSGDRCILFRVNLDARNVALPDSPARDHPCSLRTAETIRTNDGILDTSTIDTACRGVQRVCRDVQVIKGFAYH